MKILIVEDEIKLAQSLAKGLIQEGYIVDYLENGEQAQERIMGNPHTYDLIILDIMIPGKDGLEVCKTLRDNAISIPVLMLTAKDTKQDIVQGLNTGADDYLIKPFSFDELLARISALLRRPKHIIQKELTTKDLYMNLATRTVLLKNKKINLTLKEYMILEFLMRHPGQVESRESILASVWDFAFDSFSNVVDVHIKNLRKKINKHDELLETVRGVGYKLKA
jgi:DNA-binding response OmpR family regulator